MNDADKAARFLQAMRDISDMYDIWLAFRRGRVKAGLPVSSPIDSMTLDEFEAMREAALGKHEHRQQTTKENR